MFKDREYFLRIYYKKGSKDFRFCDCYGICYLFNKHVLNIKIPDFSEMDVYSTKSIENLYHNSQEQFKEVHLGKEKQGDIVSLNVKSYPIHVGVVIEKGLMLHIMEDRHANIESYKSRLWKNNINSFWRYVKQ